MKSVSEQKQSTPKIAPSFGPNEKPETVKIVVIHIFVCSDNTNVLFHWKKKYWHGRAQSNFELWPVVLTGQTNYSLAKAHIWPVKMLKHSDKILLANINLLLAFRKPRNEVIRWHLICILQIYTCKHLKHIMT